MLSEPWRAEVQPGPAGVKQGFELGQVGVSAAAAETSWIKVPNVSRI